MEYADDGDLYQKICDYKKQHLHFEEREIWKVLINIIQGLKALHAVNILHRDLKVSWGSHSLRMCLWPKTEQPN